MADFSATDVAFSGFRFAREHPRTIGLWAAVHLVVSVLLMVLLIASAGPAMMQMQALKASGQKDPAAVLPILQQIMPVYGLLILFCLVFYPMIYAAMSRAVLRPDERRYGYLRLGADEGRQLLLLLLIVVIGIGAETGGTMMVVILSILASLAAKTFGALAALVLGLALIGGLVFCAVRLSLCSPLTFARGRVDLFGSWALTRGRFWKLFGTYLLVMAICLAVALVLMLLYAAVGATGGLRGLAGVFRPDMSSLAAYFTPIRMIMTVVGAGFSAMMWPLLLMPPVEIYKALRPVAP